MTLIAQLRQLINNNLEAKEGGVSCRVCEVDDYDNHAPECPIGKLIDILQLGQLGEQATINILTGELLDLITLMPDSQTQEIIDYIAKLRLIRRH